MYKFVLVVLAVAATSLADQQVLKTLGQQSILPANAAYLGHPLSGYATGYTSGAAAVYPQYQQYQQYAQYPAGYAGYAYPGYQQYQGYQGYVAPMSYAPVAAAHSAYPYAAHPVVYQQKHVAATPANAYSVL